MRKSAAEQDPTPTSGFGIRASIKISSLSSRRLRQQNIPIPGNDNPHSTFHNMYNFIAVYIEHLISDV
jgi:hypothetical protein